MDGHGAAVGRGERGTWGVEEGAFVLRVTPTTQRFVDLSKVLPVGEAQALSVAVRMKTQDLDSSAAKFKNCDVFVRFDDGSSAPSSC